MVRTLQNKLENRLTLPQRTFCLIVLILCFLLMVLPMWDVLVTSTSTVLDSSSSGLRLWWKKFSIEGYTYIFSQLNLWKNFLNSVYVSLVGVVAQVLLSAFAGYVLIQRELPGKKMISSFILLTMMIPADLTLISIYQLNKQLGLTNSFTGLIINGIVSGFSILLMRNYFLSVPYSLSESSRLDGASEYYIFFKIYMPVSLPGLSTVFFLEFVSRWNNVMIPATLLTDASKYTLPLVLRTLISPDTSTVSGGMQITPNVIMAGVVISTIPLLVTYIFSQQFLLSGMTLGSSKE